MITWINSTRFYSFAKRSSQCGWSLSDCSLSSRDFYDALIIILWQRIRWGIMCALLPSKNAHKISSRIMKNLEVMQQHFGCGVATRSATRSRTTRTTRTTLQKRHDFIWIIFCGYLEITICLWVYFIFLVLIQVLWSQRAYPWHNL